MIISNEMKKEVEKNKYYNVEMFKKDCKTYIEAVKSGRILYNVEHVSASGMIRMELLDKETCDILAQNIN